MTLPNVLVVEPKAPAVKTLDTSRISQHTIHLCGCFYPIIRSVSDTASNKATDSQRNFNEKFGAKVDRSNTSLSDTEYYELLVSEDTQLHVALPKRDETVLIPFDKINLALQTKSCLKP